MSEKAGRRIVYVGSSQRDLAKFPRDVVDVVAHALTEASLGRKPVEAKPLKGFPGATTLEVVEDFDTDTYRAVYTVRFKDAVYVLHCFQKKSKSGIATPKQEIGLIKKRLAWAAQLSEEWLARQREENPREQARRTRA